MLVTPQSTLLLTHAHTRTHTHTHTPGSPSGGFPLSLISFSLPSSSLPIPDLVHPALLQGLPTAPYRLGMNAWICAMHPLQPMDSLVERALKLYRSTAGLRKAHHIHVCVYVQLEHFTEHWMGTRMRSKLLPSIKKSKFFMQLSQEVQHAWCHLVLYHYQW